MGEPTTEPTSGWRRRLRAWHSDRFLRRVALLSSGTIVGQLIVVLVSPLLTRLYSPEEFGVFAVFNALTTILGTVICLRYEQAVPVVADDEAAAAMVAVSAVVTVFLTAGLGAVIALAGPVLAGLLGAPDLASLLWLVPAAMLLWGFTLPLALWSIRRGSFRANALNKTLQLATQAFAQAGLGFAGGGSVGLVVGYCLGYVARFAHFGVILSPPDWRLLRLVRWRQILRLAVEHWVYPAYSTPAFLLQSSAQVLPAMLLAMLYGPATAGWFALGQRMLEVPVRLLSMSTSAVYLNEAARGEPAEVYRLFLQTSRRFALIGFAGMAPFLLAGPWLFATIFGADWRVAGTMVQCLVPLQLARFVVMPVSQTLNVFRRQDLHLLVAGLNLMALTGSFLVGWRLRLDATQVVLLFGAASSLSWLIYYLLAWRVARDHARRVGGVDRPPVDPVPPAGFG